MSDLLQPAPPTPQGPPVFARFRGEDAPYCPDRPIVGECVHVLGREDGHFKRGRPVEPGERALGDPGSDLPQVWFDWTPGICDVAKIVLAQPEIA